MMRCDSSAVDVCCLTVTLPSVTIFKFPKLGDVYHAASPLASFARDGISDGHLQLFGILSSAITR
jgi:hypothetical protein